MSSASELMIKMIKKQKKKPDEALMKHHKRKDFKVLNVLGEVIFLLISLIEVGDVKHLLTKGQ